MNVISYKFLRACYRRLRPHSLRNIMALSLAGFELCASPEVKVLPPGRRVMVLAPHADDETIGCGGVIRKLRDQGVAVKVLFVSDGRFGDRNIREMSDNDPQKTEKMESLREKRRKEAVAALSHLGVNEYTFFDFPDGGLIGCIDKMQSVFMENILAWDADAVYFPFISDCHSDHQAVSIATIDAISKAPKAIRKKLVLCSYEIWSPLCPNLVVDISEQVDAKREALKSYTSQLEGTDYLNSIMGLNQYRTMMGLNGKGYAEAFYYGSFELFFNLLKEARS